MSELALITAEVVGLYGLHSVLESYLASKQGAKKRAKLKSRLRGCL